MLWVINCIDKPNSATLRAKHLDNHRAYLNEKDPIIFFSGPLQTDDAKESVGSLFAVNVKSRAEAQAFIDAEPFNRAGVFSSVTIKRTRKGHFNPALADIA